MIGVLFALLIVVGSTNGQHFDPDWRKRDWWGPDDRRGPDDRHGHGRRGPDWEEGDWEPKHSGPPHHGPRPPVKWWKTQPGFCFDEDGRTYSGFRNIRPHHPLNCLVEAQSFVNDFLSPDTQIRGFHVGFDVGPICDVLIDSDVHPDGDWEELGWMPIETGENGNGPVNDHVPPPDFGTHITCLPSPDNCDMEVKFCSDQHHTLVGKMPDTCKFLLCPSTPPPKPTPVACQCQEALQNPGEKWDSMSFYCAKLTKDSKQRACEPMSEIPTTGLPSSICQPGWLECPGRPTSLNPVDTGDRCGCNSYIDASPDESMLCVGPNSFRNGKMERVCKLPYTDGTCPSSYTVCRSPRVVSATLNASLQYFLHISRPWSLQYYLKLQLVKAMQLNTTSYVKLYSICPASSCGSGTGCPATHEERLNSGYVFTVFMGRDIHITETVKNNKNN